jgi:hypothetical protein
MAETKITYEHVKKLRSGELSISQFMEDTDCAINTAYDAKSGRRWNKGIIQYEVKKQHGYSGHKLYSVWGSMRSRCVSESNHAYHDYGGRGISVCGKWKDNPVEFIEWSLKNGWVEGLQLDRIDNNGDYEPSNCRFVTASLNMDNRRFLTSRNKTGYRGVSECSGVNLRKKYKASICIFGSKKSLRRFELEKNAAIYRDCYAMAFNPFAKLNFPQLNSFIGD